MYTHFRKLKGKGKGKHRQPERDDQRWTHREHSVPRSTTWNNYADWTEDRVRQQHPSYRGPKIDAPWADDRARYPRARQVPMNDTEWSDDGYQTASSSNYSPTMTTRPMASYSVPGTCLNVTVLGGPLADLPWCQQDHLPRVSTPDETGPITRKRRRLGSGTSGAGH